MTVSSVYFTRTEAKKHHVFNAVKLIKQGIKTVIAANGRGVHLTA